MNFIEFEEIRINDDSKTCSINGKRINLTFTEYNLLKFLMNNTGKILSRENISKEIWDSPIGTRTIDTTISRLRNKLGIYSKYIVSRTGFGYGLLKDEY